METVKEMKNKAIHTGHRERLRNRFLREGLDSFEDIQVLELLLFYCIPRKDTNLIAHRLLDEFGSLARVFEATPKELTMVDGMGENAATLFSLISQLSRYCAVNQLPREKIMTSVEDCGNYMLPYFKARTMETVFLLCMDAKGKVKCCKKVGEGNVNSADVSIRKIAEMALTADATSVVLAHNHPSGIAIPSDEDVLTTKKLAMALKAMDIELADHLVMVEDDFVSLAQSGMFDPGECCVLL